MSEALIDTKIGEEMELKRIETAKKYPHVIQFHQYAEGVFKNAEISVKQEAAKLSDEQLIDICNVYSTGSGCFKTYAVEELKTRKPNFFAALKPYCERDYPTAFIKGYLFANLEKGEDGNGKYR